MHGAGRIWFLGQDGTHRAAGANSRILSRAGSKHGEPAGEDTGFERRFRGQGAAAPCTVLTWEGGWAWGMLCRSGNRVRSISYNISYRGAARPILITIHDASSTRRQPKTIPGGLELLGMPRWRQVAHLRVSIACKCKEVRNLFLDTRRYTLHSSKPCVHETASLHLWSAVGERGRHARPLTLGMHVDMAELRTGETLRACADLGSVGWPQHGTGKGERAAIHRTGQTGDGAWTRCRQGEAAASKSRGGSTFPRTGRTTSLHIIA